jgi:hypothetical protein
MSGQALNDWSYEFGDWQKQWEPHRGKYRTQLVAVDTFGTRSVMEAANSFLDAVDAGAGPDELGEKRRSLIEAVRADVAPD